MDPSLVSSITSEVLKTLIETGTKFLGENLVDKFRRSREESKRLDNYIYSLTNRVSYFVTYRPSPQHVDEVYVRPLILDSVLTQTYTSPDQFEVLSLFIDDLIKNGGDLLEVIALYESAPELKTIIQSIKYISFEDLVTEYPGILVLSEAGSGKSSLLSYLCLSRLKLKKARLPIFLDVRNLESNSVLHSIDEVLKITGFDDIDFKRLDSTLALYIDGLDELSPARYKETCYELGELRRTMPSIQITAACRSAAYRNELSFLKEVSLIPFDRERVEVFIKCWFSSINSGPSASDLIEQISKNTRLSELACQPLLLSLMCNAFRRYLNISRRQSTLFDQCISSLLWQWDADRTVKRTSNFAALDLEKKIWLHSNLASHLHNARKRFCDKEFMEKRLQKDLPLFGIKSNEAGKVLNELCVHHGILVKWTEDTYGFAHLALQEFLTAKWYANEARWQGLINREILLDPWWENVISLCSASLSDASQVVQAILNLAGISEIRKLQLLAACLRHDPIILPNLREQILKSIFDLYHNGDAKEHDAALYMLLGIEDDWTKPSIEKSLGGRLLTKKLVKLLESAQRQKLLKDEKVEIETSLASWLSRHI